MGTKNLKAPIITSRGCKVQCRDQGLGSGISETWLIFFLFQSRIPGMGGDLWPLDCGQGLSTTQQVISVFLFFSHLGTYGVFTNAAFDPSP